MSFWYCTTVPTEIVIAHLAYTRQLDGRVLSCKTVRKTAAPRRPGCPEPDVLDVTDGVTTRRINRLMYQPLNIDKREWIEHGWVRLRGLMQRYSSANTLFSLIKSHKCVCVACDGFGLLRTVGDD